MDLRRLRASDWLAGVAGAALIGLLWAPWYQGSEGAYFSRAPGRVGYTLNAWQSMAVNDVIFCIAGLLGIWLLIATATSSTQAMPIAATVFASLIGLLASVLAVVRLIWPPDLGPGPTGRAAGVWLGAAAAIGLTASALVSMRDERRGEGIEVPITPLPAPKGGEA
ncbi:MAG TPA: hypothetical protein VF032_01970 [Thermoleophilaceae bacterium]